MNEGDGKDWPENEVVGRKLKMETHLHRHTQLVRVCERECALLQCGVNNALCDFG